MSTIQVTTGSEGPRHDPYSYTEITVTRPNGVSVMLHEGLDYYVAVNGRRCEQECEFQKNATFDQREKLLQAAADAVFESIAGISPRVAFNAYRRLRSRCQRCGCRETRSMAGYPGESFEVCVKCGHIVDSHFDISAIE